MTAVSCNNSDKGNSEVDRIKKECVGSWKGNMTELFGGKEVTVTFTSDGKITTTGNLSQKITKWDYAEGSGVWVTLDDDMASAMNIYINGSTMKLTGNSTFILANFPGTLTKVK